MRYWERKAEQAREGGTKPKKENKTEKSSTSDNNTPASGSSNSKGKGKKKAAPEPTRTNILDKLGKDSKQLSKEHQRRIDNNLCLLCGADSHKVAECPKSTQA